MSGKDLEKHRVAETSFTEREQQADDLGFLKVDVADGEEPSHQDLCNDDHPRPKSAGLMMRIGRGVINMFVGKHACGITRL